MKGALTDFFRPLLLVSGIYLLLSLLLRLVLWWAFGLPARISFAQVPFILLGGLANDSVELIYLLAPFSLYRLLMPVGITSHRLHRRLAGVTFFLLLFGMLYLASVEYFFFDEFDSRFNLVAVDYLIYPTEVLVNVWDSYPVLQVILGMLLLAGVMYRWCWRHMDAALAKPARLRERGKAFALHALLIALAAFGFSTTTLAFSANRVSNQISSNGISSLFQAFFTNNLDYTQHYRTIEDDRAFALVREGLAKGGGDFVTDELQNINRAFAENPAGLGKMNVVVIVEESLGAGYVGAYGGKRQLTPNFDRLAESGLLFRNAFATGTRTVRGLEAISTSFPPIPSESIVKRPGSEGVANWGKVMAEHGYHSSFLYGGYGYFDNMNHFFSSNGFAISDRADIPEPTFANIWGVCDEDLFRHALDYFDGIHQQGQPFFSIIMTTSNHKPYTFPAGIEGVPAEGGGRRAGVRYADYALGRLFALAPEHDWYDNTLFVVVADHDARVYGRAQVPVERYRIPLLFYAPGRLPAKTVETITSQIDIAPTVLNLLGLSYTAPFYGQNVLNPVAGARPLLLNHNHDVAYIDGERMVVLGLQGATDFFRYSADSDSLEPAEADPALADRATAYYQTAFELFKSHRYE
ncbi:LTA synthase family protein [Trichloromonas sp.]|uniref:LTA synthase family protein n=1 Tax=Trichloromonas sp. TaxID=3069249 RepID=UPI003D818579